MILTKILPVIVLLAVTNAAVAVDYSFRVASKGVVASAAPAPATGFAKWTSFGTGASAPDGLTASFSGSTWKSVMADKGKSTGKYYFELKVAGTAGTGTPDGAMFGLGQSMPADAQYIGSGHASAGVGYYSWSGVVYRAGIANPAGPAVKIGDTFGIAADLDNKTVQYFINCTAVSSVIALPAGTTFYPIVSAYSLFPSVTANFGASALTCARPSGFTAGWN